MVEDVSSDISKLVMVVAREGTEWGYITLDLSSSVIFMESSPATVRDRITG